MIEQTREQWRYQFAMSAALTREEKDRIAREFFKKQRASEEKEAKDEKEDRREFAEMILTEQQIATFKAKLDNYDRATVDALMENGIELDAVREEIDQMLVEAHTLPDGRKVFKTRDGKKVFDQNGTELKPEEIKPDEIDDKRTRWEDFKAAVDRENALTTERAELHAYQEKLDRARDRSDDPNFSEDEMKAIERDLGETAPERVRRKLGNDQEAPAVKAEQGAAPAAEASAGAAFFQRRAELTPG